MVWNCLQRFLLKVSIFFQVEIFWTKKINDNETSIHSSSNHIFCFPFVLCFLVFLETVIKCGYWSNPGANLIDTFTTAIYAKISCASGMIETHQNPKVCLISKFFILAEHQLFPICWSLILFCQLIKNRTGSTGTETSHFRFVGCLEVWSCLLCMHPCKCACF